MPPGAQDRALPAPTTSFVGRRSLLRDIRKLLATSRLVTLTGPGGVGKTRIAMRAASEAAVMFDDGVCLVELASITGDESVADAVVHALGVEDQSSRRSLEKVADHLCDSELLLVLDNCEHVLVGCVELIGRVLHAAPAVRVLATTRIALGVTSEFRLPVPQMTAPEPGDTPPFDALPQYESVQLFIDRAAAAVPGWSLTEQNATAVAQLCAQLEGIPLAIELAVPRLRTLSVEAIIERLRDRFKLLSSGSRDAQPRQQTLRRLIDWSYELCTPAEQRLWARLSTFAGGFDLVAAEGICSEPEGPAVLDLLGFLIDQSVLMVETTESGRRFRMLETLRAYGAERLIELGESDRQRARHRRYYLELAESVSGSWCGPDQVAGLAQLRLEKDNLRAALDSCDPAAEPDYAVELIAALKYRWFADGYIAEGRRWCDEALDRGSADGSAPAPVPARATALWAAAWVCLLQGEPAAAQRRIEECAQLAAQLSDPVSLAYVLKMRGLTALFADRLDAASTFYSQAAEALRATGSTAGLLAVSFQHALCLSMAGRFDESREISTTAFTISQAHGEQWARSYIQWARGVDCWLRGDHRAAEELGREALALHCAFNLSVGTALMTELLAWIATSTGSYDRAAKLLGAADSLWRNTSTTIAAFGDHLSGYHDSCQDRVRSALPARQLEAHRGAGAALSAAQAVAYALGQDATDNTAALEAECPLTRRQLEIAQGVAQGLSNREIASRLVLSTRTVDSHVENILMRLGFTSRSQIAAWVADPANATADR